GVSVVAAPSRSGPPRKLGSEGDERWGVRGLRLRGTEL
ncbi:MAG: hypothetical protein AVDCRST_MAG25-1434, partial [uncultured Rubrobacteraceae bacterium]